MRIAAFQTQLTIFKQKPESYFHNLRPSNFGGILSDLMHHYLNYFVSWTMSVNNFGPGKHKTPRQHQNELLTLKVRALVSAINIVLVTDILWGGKGYPAGLSSYVGHYSLPASFVVHSFQCAI